MATGVDDQELVDRFEEFFRNYYQDEIGALARNYPSEDRSLSIDWQDLFRFDTDLADDYLDRPEQLQRCAEEALRVFDLPVDVKLGQAHVRITNLPETTPIRELRARHVNTLVSVSGIVRKATDVRPKVQNAAFQCQRCESLTQVPQTGGDFQEPHECRSCERQGPFRLNFDQSEFVDAQRLRVQESPEGLRGGETPQSIDVDIEDDITGEVTPGDRVTATGILRLDQSGEGDSSPVFDVHMEGVSVELEDEEFEDMDITEADKREIVELSNEDDLYERMVDSMAPTIHGYREEKLAMVLQLFSGVTKHLPDGSRIRGDLHMLLIGDPGTGKCVSGDTRVTLGDGTTVPIEELVEANLDDPKPVDDGVYDEVDIEVPSMTPSGRLIDGTATKVWKREAPEQLYQIRTAAGAELAVTPSHPLFIPGTPLEARTADSLQVGDRIVRSSVSSAGSTVRTDGGTIVQSADCPITLGTGLEWDEITSIETVEPDDEWVYDLEVAGTHSYVSNGIVSHNSQMLQYIRNIAPRSVYTSGKGSSSAGLTAAAVRDDFGDGQQWTLEAGALVLADQGIAAVDELDKMRPEDRSAMHEALEQQSYHPETELLLADGQRVQIGKLVDERMEDRPEEIVDGVNCDILPVDDLRVHTVDPETGAEQKTTVDRVSRHEAPDQFVRVTFSNGRSVTVTPEHPMFVDDGGIETVPATEIEEDDFVPAPRKLSNSPGGVSMQSVPERSREKTVTFPTEVTPDLAEFLGLLVAEGHTYAGSSHEVGFSNQDERLLARAEQLAQSVFAVESNETTNDAGTVTKRWISTRLYRWFEENVPELMETARGKRIPQAILGSSEEVNRRFLVGAFAGDGGVESEAMSFSTASPGLAEDYADSLAKLGIASRIHHDSTEDSYKTYVMGNSTERFVETIVTPADGRYDDALAFVERSNETPRHHDVLPTSAVREIRSLRSLLGLPRTGQFKPHIDNGYGVQIETVADEVTALRERIESVRSALPAADSLERLREVIGWSARELGERIGETASTISYAENGGYDEAKRSRLQQQGEQAVQSALSDADGRLAELETRCSLRYYRVTDVETVANDGDDRCEWVYDVTVEPTNTFVSKGVVLHNSISVSKAGINATLKSRCSLLGAANPKYGRFDQYEPIGEQIDLEPALISRFDLIFTVTDQPDEEEDAALAEHILTTNYAGELNTQREEMASPDITRDDVEAVQEEVEPSIESELFRKYVAYAQQNCHPRMTEEAQDAIREFYVNLRSKGADEDAPVPVTARKLEALVRLAEASARVRLADEVSRADAERVIEIVRSCLQDIGVDPETGQFDADVVETGTSKSQRDRIKNLKGLIQELEAEYEEGVPVDVVIDEATEIGLDRSKAEGELEKLKQKGEVYEPRTEHVRTT